MKKLLLLTLPLLFLSGCVLVNDTTNNSPVTETITTTWTEVFDSSHITFIVDDTAMESYYVYDNIKKYGNWYIWVQIWWNDGISSNLLYIEDGKIIKKMNNIFWYNFYVDHKIHEFCWETLDSCPVVKETNCTINTDKNEDCVYSFVEYMFNLLQWTETNIYFSEKLQNFENSL